MAKTITLRLLDTYFRHRWLYLLPIVLMVIAAGIYIYQQQHLYMTSGIIFTEKSSLLSSLTAVDQQGYSWITPAQETAGQISDLIKTDAFIRAVIRETDLEAQMSRGGTAVQDLIREIRGDIFVSAAGNNQVQIFATSDNPRTAYQLAQAAINTFILWNINLDRTDSVTAEVFFQDLIRGYQADVLAAQDTLRSYLESHPKPVNGDRPDTETFEIQNLQSTLDAANTRLAQASQKAEDARLANVQVESNVRQKYMVVDAPGLTNEPATSKRKMATGAAVFLAAGLLLSGIAVVGATLFDQSLHLPVEVSQTLSLPVVAILSDESAPASKHTRERKREPVQESKGDPILEKPKDQEQLTTESTDRTGQREEDGTATSDLPASGDDPNPEQPE